MVKCEDCGFLSVRDVRTRQLVEMEKDYREKGESPQVIDYSPHFNIYDTPRCFVQANNLRDELKKDEQQCSLQEKIRTIITYERNCESFTKWQQGFTPKEHQEMIDREKMLIWQEGREIADRKWRERQDDKHSGEDWRRYVLLAIATILAGVVGAQYVAIANVIGALAKSLGLSVELLSTIILRFIQLIK